MSQQFPTDLISVSLAITLTGEGREWVIRNCGQQYTINNQIMVRKSTVIAAKQRKTPGWVAPW